MELNIEDRSFNSYENVVFGSEEALLGTTDHRGYYVSMAEELRSYHDDLSRTTHFFFMLLDITNRLR